jgi:hypothetical protein
VPPYQARPSGWRMEGTRDSGFFPCRGYSECPIRSRGPGHVTAMLLHNLSIIYLSICKLNITEDLFSNFFPQVMYYVPNFNLPGTIVQANGAKKLF